MYHHSKNINLVIKSLNFFTMFSFSPAFSKFAEAIEGSSHFKNYIKEFLEVLNSNFEWSHFERILKEYSIEKIEDVKLKVLDVLMSYANFNLSDSLVTADEIQDFTILKKVFRIKEGDFMRFKKFEAYEILKREIIGIYSGHFVGDKEKLMNLHFQSMFDLSYDEFEELKKEEVIFSLMHGAYPQDLDISKIPREFKGLK